MFFKKQLADEMSSADLDHIASFLYAHLDRFGDPLEDIHACIDYARDPSRGGIIYGYQANDTLHACSIVLNTKMEGFIPPYILVYIAVAETMRGQGTGGKLIEFIQKDLNAPIALHVEKDNPAFRLYDRKGFTSKYLEMRWNPDGTS